MTCACVCALHVVVTPPALCGTCAPGAAAAKPAAGPAAGGDDGADGDGLLAGVEEEDVDDEDVYDDGSMFKDERGRQELELVDPARLAALQASGAVIVEELPEHAIPREFDAVEGAEGAVCRILDNFFLCDADGSVCSRVFVHHRVSLSLDVTHALSFSRVCRHAVVPFNCCDLRPCCSKAVGLEVLDDKQLRAGVIAFGSVVVHPPAETSASKRTRALLHALGLEYAEAAIAEGVGMSSAKPPPFGSVRKAIPAASPEEAHEVCSRAAFACCVAVHSQAFRGWSWRVPVLHVCSSARGCAACDGDAPLQGQHCGDGDVARDNQDGCVNCGVALVLLSLQSSAFTVCGCAAASTKLLLRQAHLAGGLQEHAPVQFVQGCGHQGRLPVRDSGRWSRRTGVQGADL